MAVFTDKGLLSMDSAKAIKANGFGYLNAILYMAPAHLAGVGNLCPNMSTFCFEACLGWHSGQAGMVKAEADLNSVRRSRINKARAFMRDRVSFVRRVAIQIAKAERKANRKGFKLCVRLNGSADIAWEGVAVDVDAATATAIGCEAGRYANLMTLFPQLQFVDYTKNPNRVLANKLRRKLPANYHLTFSRAENNEHHALDVLRNGGNVAVVFGEGLPAAWHGFPVVDGDEHDLRHLDPRGGFVVGLSPKGNKAKRDQGGFVVRNYH